jgi:hypothetical protein
MKPSFVVAPVLIRQTPSARWHHWCQSIRSEVYMRSVFILVCFTAAAYAEPRDVLLSLTIEDQVNFKEICRAAIQNANLSTPVVYSISAWCLTKDQQIKQLVDKPKEESK